MLSKDEALARTRDLQRFLQDSLPEAGFCSSGQGAEFVEPFNKVIDAIENDRFNDPNVIGVFGIWRALADYFGTSDDHPIMGPYNQLSAEIIAYLKHTT